MQKRWFALPDEPLASEDELTLVDHPSAHLGQEDAVVSTPVVSTNPCTTSLSVSRRQQDVVHEHEELRHMSA